MWYISNSMAFPMFICRINYFTFCNRIKNIHLYWIFSCSIRLRCINSDCSARNGEKYKPFIRYIRRFSEKPWVWFDRKAQTQSFILSLTVYWSCFREATSARRKHESIIYILASTFSSKNITTSYVSHTCTLICLR